ncbi:MAG: hypothetical protein Q4B54_08685 [Coriobacteriales bacterium]|nr:hypothetical protein [Coriobacteriales bacterium]
MARKNMSTSRFTNKARAAVVAGCVALSVCPAFAIAATGGFAPQAQGFNMNQNMAGMQQGQMPEGELPELPEGVEAPAEGEMPEIPQGQMQQNNKGNKKAQMNKRNNTNATTLAASTTK